VSLFNNSSEGAHNNATARELNPYLLPVDLKLLPEVYMK
jgi:hypothetical protein